MPLFVITATDPDFDLEANSFFRAVDAAITCAKAGAEEIDVYEQLADDDWEAVDWWHCLTPTERDQFTAAPS